LITALAAVLFAIRITAPPDLMDKDQERPAAYVLDAVCNGHWICQRDWLGAVTSKPPLYTWLAALASLPTGQVSRATLLLPSALATIGTGLLILGAGWRMFGKRAGLLAAVAYLLSFAAVKQVALARTDGLFTFTVAITAMLAFCAWSTGRGWIWFWLAGAAATLTKGPLGLVLGAVGLVAQIWEARSGGSRRLKGSHWAGVLLFLAITLGWFGLAYRQMGRDLIDQIFRNELVGHIVTSKRGAGPFSQFYKPWLYFLVRFAPWSLAACVGLVRVCRRPATDESERRFERFLFCWCVLGLALFGIGAHVRGDLVFPIIPAAALLAGRELERWTQSVRERTCTWGLGVAVAIGLGLVWLNYHHLEASKPYTKQTRGMQILAKQFRELGGVSGPLTHVDDPFSLQFYLNTMQTTVTVHRAAMMLQGQAAAFVAVRNLTALTNELAGATNNLHILARWPASGEAFVTIVGNQPQGKISP
jgi:4-amino-4-deoxy-L-arabinose transferase-like glycosyltransferase